MLKNWIPLDWRLRARELQAGLTAGTARGEAVLRARRAYLNWARSHPGEPLILGVGGARMRLDPVDRTISEAIFLYRTWEPFETELLRRAVHPGDVMLDIGAHIGYYSVVAARAMRGRGCIYAFEPSPTNFAFLEENIRLNDLASVVHPRHAALFREPGEIELYLADHNSGDNRIYPSTPTEDTFINGHPSGERRVVRVPALRGDDFLAEQGVNRVDLIKMDVQGAETEVLRGLAATLRSPNLILFTEFWPYGLRRSGVEPGEFVDLLQKLGFSFFHICMDRHVVEPVEAGAFVAAQDEADPREQIDLICCRSEALLRERGILR